MKIKIKMYFKYIFVYVKSKNRAQMNFFMKQMLKGKLQDGVERLADMLAMLPY